ncbi:MAG: FKBP-type peptidyl-prolyl cis-trans isomerase [Sphingomonadales bacterium]|nr:FKBP-type peptidyl-prolyl cis-trans isomerase [Sphingomonadales bacterium]
MTEITRVPLQPIAKGALTKLWLGVAAVALAAGGVVWASLPPGVDVETIKAGTGTSPTEADVVTINYKGTLPDGKVFDQAQSAKLPLQGIIPGFTKALVQMKPGGKYKVVIPSELAYGKEGAPGIAPNTDLTFEIDLLKVQSRASAEQEMQAEQAKAMEAMAAEQGKGGKKSGAEAPPGGMPPELEEQPVGQSGRKGG